MGWLPVVGDKINTTSAKWNSNEIYMGGDKGVFSVDGTDYVVYQQIKSDDAKQIWLNVNGVSIPMNGFQTKNVWNNNANPDISIAGIGLTAEIRANQVHNDNVSPLTGKDAPYYGISTQRASHQIWFPHKTTMQVAGVHKNVIKYVYDDGSPVLDANGNPLVKTQETDLTRDLTLDITKDKLDDIKNYALSHTSDQTLEYIKHSQAVSQDSGWKMTDAAGNPVTDPYAAVESPKLDGYTATIKSTNAPGVTQGADGSEVQAKLKINPDAVVKDGELTDAYKNNGVTGIPENYETVVVYKKEAEKGSVTVKYIDDTADKTLETKDLSGEVGENSDYSTAPTIEDYTDKGYKLVSDDYPKSGVTFTKEPQKYEVHLKHTYNPVTPDDPHDVDPNEVTKNVKETVHYTGASDKTPNDNVQNATWTPSETDYKAVPSPKVDGYTPDKETVPSTPVTMDDINVTVTYTKNETPVVPPDSPNPIPEPTPTPQPEPKKPETPKTPEKDKTPEPDESDEPDVPTPRRHHKNKKHTPAPKPANNWSNNYAPHGQNGYYNNFGPHGQGTPGPNGETIMPNGEVLDRNGNVVGYIDANGKIHYTLPQTGENQSEGVAAAALGGAVVAIGLVGLVGVKRRHTN